jgi:hypothetical protein
VVKDLGTLNSFLGIEVQHTTHGLFLTQQKYICDLLMWTNMTTSNGVHTPMYPCDKLAMSNGTPLSSEDSTRYRSVVGALQYLSLTRPDISFAINHVCQFMTKPTSSHWSTVKRILRYLNHTIQLDLYFVKSASLFLGAFSNADCARDIDSHHSTSGYAIFLGGNLVSWSAQKQSTVSRSSTEVKYKAVADATAELIWLRVLLHELGISLPRPPSLWCDNIGATYLSANPIFH